VRMCCMSRPTVLVSLLFYHYHTSLISPLLFFLTDPATPEIYTLSLHDALPIFSRCPSCSALISAVTGAPASLARLLGFHDLMKRSEEHTSELQSRENLVCRLLLEKKKNKDCVVPRLDQSDQTTCAGTAQAFRHY